LPAATKLMSAEKRRPAVFSQIKEQPAATKLMSAEKRRPAVFSQMKQQPR
jgi:hypothetical protein